MKGNFGKFDPVTKEPINYTPWWYGGILIARESSHIPEWKALGCEREPPLGSEWELAIHNMVLDARWAEIEGGIHPSCMPDRIIEGLAKILAKVFS